MITYSFTLTEEERQQLEAIKTKGSHRSQSALNAIILLKCDQGKYQTNRAANQQICSVLALATQRSTA